MNKVFTLFLSLISIASYSQKKIICGTIKDSLTNEYIAYASVTNIHKNKTSITTENGVFKIEAEEGNILSFASINHYFDTLFLTDKILQKDSLNIFLKPIAKNLKEVTVVAAINRYQNDSMLRRKEFLKDVGGNKISTFDKANSGAGFAINLDRFSKREKHKRKAFELFDAMEEEQYINYRFPVQLVTKYTTLRNEELLEFINTYRPSYKWLRNHLTEEDLKYYINEKLKLYFKKKKK